MSSSNEHAVKVLNSLIETTLDSAKGYEEAAENADASQFKGMFNQRSQGRHQLAQSLQREVSAFGGEPDTHQSVLGRIHNKFVDIKKVLTGGSDKAVIDEVERGEDFIKGKFEDAMRDSELPEQARAVVSRAFETIKSDHDEVSQLKRQVT